jgi:hypothetical protein|tara:strand:- start:166 stop:573 length:408 start_codon:yes stop_codon:yes gene_type:complete
MKSMKNKTITEHMKEENIVYSYTSNQAVEDGILFDMNEMKGLINDVEKGIFSHITSNLLFSKGYMKEGEDINLPNLLDLLNQCGKIMNKDFDKKGLIQVDTFHSGEIELPNGEKQMIFIELNETGRFTILLPEDH